MENTLLEMLARYKDERDYIKGHVRQNTYDGQYFEGCVSTWDTIIADLENLLGEKGDNMAYNLEPVLSGQKSFYNKAVVIMESIGEPTLLSYKTKIISLKNGKIDYLNPEISKYSNTTMKHVRDFLYQYDHVLISKDDIRQLIKERDLK